MAERERFIDLESALRALGAEIELPQAPSIAPAVTARILADRAARRAPPPFPGIALWPRRRILALAVAGVLLLAGGAVAARLAIGAIEIRVVPILSPGSTTPETGPALGETVTLARARRAVAFPILLPPGLGSPTEVHLAQSLFRLRTVVLVWQPDGMHPRIGGTPWGTILLELTGDHGPLAYKELAENVPIESVLVNGQQAFWISGPHDLVVRTPGGERRLSVRGNVLLWSRGGTTMRLETALDQPSAIALAETIR